MVNCIVIEDDEQTLDIFCELLENNGINVLGRGKNGKDAVSLYKKFNPDLIFVDFVMPKYDGFYAIVHIKKFDPDAKIVVVTGVNKISKSYLLNNLGVTGVIYKPINLKIVKEVIDKIFLENPFYAQNT